MRNTSTARGWAAAIAAIWLSVAALPATAQEPAKVRAAFVPTASFLPLWVAKDEGIFAKLGLDVTLTPIQNLGLLPGAAGKQFEIIPSTPPDFLKAVAGGIDIVAVAGLVLDEKANTITQIVVPKASGITDIKQLAGKTVAAPSIGAISNVAFLYWLKKSGVDPNSVKVVEVPYPNMGDQLKGGRVDAIQSIQPFLSKHLAEGNVSLGSHLLVVQDPALFVFWSAEGAWAKANGKTLAKWEQALTQARARIKADEKAARAILAKYTGLPPAIADTVPLPTYQFTIEAKQLQTWDGVLRELGQLTQPLDIAKLVQTAR